MTIGMRSIITARDHNCRFAERQITVIFSPFRCWLIESEYEVFMELPI